MPAISADDDYKFMRRCLDLAGNSRGLTYPNPLVGSVVVVDGKIAGEGFHLRAGTAHAEVIAINSVKEQALLSSSTLYVNLEPCSHYGKTPPCADFIISKGIKKVVVGTVDPNSLVAGRGVAKLREAGCEVVVGVMEAECRYLNRRFFAFHEKQRPYIILKWAQSIDGFIDTYRSEQSSGPIWISGKPERVLVHKWRTEEQSILVGAETIRKDNPLLNARYWKGHDPMRLILSSSGSVGNDRAIAGLPGHTLIFTHSVTRDTGKLEFHLLEKHIPSASQIAAYLHDAGIQSLFVEGGAAVLNHFISEDLWDEMRIFTGKTAFRMGIKAPRAIGKIMSEIEFSDSRLTTYLK